MNISEINADKDENCFCRNRWWEVFLQVCFLKERRILKGRSSLNFEFQFDCEGSLFSKSMYM